ncbi:MAG: Type II secretion system protein G [Microgenomates bacterium 39_7]|nr:MAG: Type II secretion system protein G [Microgenomates bacterium 39_7]
MLRLKTKGFTLIELLIVIAIIGILLIIVFVHINPLRERNRATDSRRKADLDRISIALEEFYSDNDCYPTLERFNLSGGLQPYLSETPRDPDTNKSYFYSPQDLDCPQYYRIYANLRWQDDPVIDKVGCGAGCGPDGIYNYGTASPGYGLETGETTTGCSSSPDVNGIGACWTCVPSHSEELGIDVCDCNQSDKCGEEIPANLCFIEGTCGGNRGGPMPY